MSKSNRILSDADVEELMDSIDNPDLASDKKFMERLLERYRSGEELWEAEVYLLMVEGKIPMDPNHPCFKTENDKSAKNKFSRPKKVS